MSNIKALFIIVLCGIGLVTLWNIHKQIPPIELICKDYGIECRVETYFNKDLPNAYVTGYDNVIHIHSALKEILTKEELMPILLHELGHKVLHHPERMQYEQKFRKEVTGRNMTKEEFCTVRRAFETESDIFAALILKRYGVKGDLEAFFTKVRPGQDNNFESCTHPSPNSRIKLMREIING